MCSQGDKDPCGTGSRTGRGDIDDNRDVCGEEALNDHPGSFQQAAGGIQLDDQRFGSLALSPAYRIGDELGGDRIYNAINPDALHLTRERR